MIYHGYNKIIWYISVAYIYFIIDKTLITLYRSIDSRSCIKVIT